MFSNSLYKRVLFVFIKQRLEESVLSEEKRLTVRGPSPDAAPACLPARVREIVTKNLNDGGERPLLFWVVSPCPIFPVLIATFGLFLRAAGAMSSSVLSVQEENQVLQGELARLEDLLAHSRADRDELAIKYGAISERVSGRDVLGLNICLQVFWLHGHQTGMCVCVGGCSLFSVFA